MKISYEDAAYILNYKKHHKFEKYGCNWEITMGRDVEGQIICSIKIWLYCLLFIPTCIFEVFLLIWDGGLKDFEIPDKFIHRWQFVGSPKETDTTFGKLREVYLRKENN